MLMPDPANAAPDVLPPPVNRILALLWILLLGGRWIVVTWLLAAGALKRDEVAAWDDGILLRCYLTLLAVTLVVVALRAVRASRPAHTTAPGKASAQTGGTEPAAQAGATSAGETASRRGPAESRRR